MSDPLLFQPIRLRALTIPHRLWVSPMCQYSTPDGLVGAWHHAHIGQFAIGRAGLIIAEASAVAPEGRITPQDVGMWRDDQAEAWAPIIEFSTSQGVPIGIQLAHGGRKASAKIPWATGAAAVSPGEGGWVPQAPTAVAFGELTPPTEMSVNDIDRVVDNFAAAAARAVRVGFQTLEIHAAHGYLIHSFLSPITNRRTDSYGGSLENRMRLAVEVARAVRGAMPESMPLIVRISASDWMEGGWDIEQSIELVRALRDVGVDMIDTSSAGIDPGQSLILGPGYQMPFAHAIRSAVDIAVGTVGLITDAQQAERALQEGIADVVLVGRQFLREPTFALRAAGELGGTLEWPPQYVKAKPVG